MKNIISVITLALLLSNLSNAADFMGATVDDKLVTTTALRAGLKGYVPTVTDVVIGSLAERVGLKQGDVIIKVGDSLVGRAAYMKRFLDSTSSLTVLRGMERITLSLGATPSIVQPKTNLQATAKSSKLPTNPILRIETNMHTASINAIDVDSSGRWLLSASDDKTVRVWDLQAEEGRQLAHIIRPPIGEGNEGRLNAVAISPDGSLVAVSGFTGETGKPGTECVYLFSRHDGRLLGQASKLDNVVTHLAFSPTGRYLSAMLWAGGVRVFAVDKNPIENNGQSPIYLIAKDMDYGDQSYSSHFSQDGKWLVTSSWDGYIRSYNFDSMNISINTRQVKGLPLQIHPIVKRKTSGGNQPHSVKFSPNSKMIAVGFNDTAQVNVLAAHDLSLFYEPDTIGISDGNLGQVAWSYDSKGLFAGGVGLLSNEGKNIRYWADSGRGNAMNIKVDASNSITSLLTLPSSRIAFATADPSIGLIGPDKQQFLYLPSEIFDNRILSLKNQLFLPDLASHNVTVLPEPDTTSIPIKNWHYSDNTSLYGKALLFRNDRSQALAIAPNRKSFILGTRWFISCFENNGNMLWQKPTNSEVYAVNISTDNKIAVVAVADGTTRWYEYATGRELLALFLDKKQKRQIYWTPEGFFDHSPGGEDLIGWHLNQGKDKEALFFPASKLYKEFYRPDLVQASFEGKDISVYAKTIDINKLLSKDTIPPTVHFITKSGNSDSYDTNIKAQVCNTGGGIGDVTMFLNGMPVAVETGGRGLKVVEKNTTNQCYSFDRTITLSSGVNTIQLMAYNKANTIESLRDTVEINYSAKASKPELHVLTVAVNAYRDGDLRLKYALPDADALAELVKEKGEGLFEKVFINTLRDSDVTWDGLNQIFAKIGSKMKREDVFLLFVAGHGITDDKEGAYYFLPSDFRYTGEGAVQKQGISMTDFRNMLANVQAMKSLILLDTCNSGSFAEAIASRGMVEKTAITKLSRAVGRATIAASSKSQVALEGYNGHGAFTWTILEGIRGKAADQSGKITINTLATFIEEELPKLTYKKWGYEQVPQKTLQGMDFQIGMK